MPIWSHTGNTGGGFAPTPSDTSPDLSADPTAQLIREAIDTNRWLPTPDKVAVLTVRLHELIHRIAPEVESAAGKLPVDDPDRGGALAAVREAQHRVGLGPGNGYASAITIVRGLGRVAEDLVHHQQELQRKGEEGQPAFVPLPGAAGAGVIVLDPDETCEACHALVRGRQKAERRQDWPAMRRANALLAEHRLYVHQAGPSTDPPAHTPH